MIAGAVDQRVLQLRNAYFAVPQSVWIESAERRHTGPIAVALNHVASEHRQKLREALVTFMVEHDPQKEKGNKQYGLTELYPMAAIKNGCGGGGDHWPPLRVAYAVAAAEEEPALVSKDLSSRGGCKVALTEAGRQLYTGTIQPRLAEFAQQAAAAEEQVDSDGPLSESNLARTSLLWRLYAQWQAASKPILGRREPQSPAPFECAKSELVGELCASERPAQSVMMRGLLPEDGRGLVRNPFRLGKTPPAAGSRIDEAVAALGDEGLIQIRENTTGSFYTITQSGAAFVEREILSSLPGLVREKVQVRSRA